MKEQECLINNIFCQLARKYTPDRHLIHCQSDTKFTGRERHISEILQLPSDLGSTLFSIWQNIFPQAGLWRHSKY